jgi:hypothetical protein
VRKVKARAPEIGEPGHETAGCAEAPPETLAARDAVPWLADLAREDRGARRVLTDALHAAYDVVVDPAWPLVRAGHHAEPAERGRVLAVLGVETALTRAFPGAR